MFKKKQSQEKGFGTPINFEPTIFKGKLFRCDLVDDQDFIYYFGDDYPLDKIR